MASIEAINGCAVRPEAAEALGSRLRARIANLEYILQRDSVRVVRDHVLAPMIERLELLALLEKAVGRIGIEHWNGPIDAARSCRAG